jgi:hypothetical protein
VLVELNLVVKRHQAALESSATARRSRRWRAGNRLRTARAPSELLEVFSKRTVQVDKMTAAKVVGFRVREGRDPSAWERAAMEREAVADTRSHEVQPAGERRCSECGCRDRTATTA